MIHGLFVLTALSVPLWLASAGAPGLDVQVEPHDPLPIVGGDTAGACQFPTVVSMLVGGGSSMVCTGTLIHPQIVLTAAHCLLPESPIDAVGFGEKSPDVGNPALVVDTVDCVGHPDYGTTGAHDVAYCVLEQPVSLPIVPLIAGCELDALVPGQEVVIVGFGSTYAVVDEEGNFLEIEGVGTKRYTTQTVHSHSVELGEVNMLGVDNMHSACFGDSGGPAFVRLADGTWRVFGTGSHLFDTGAFPPPPDGNTCGAGVAYGHAGLVAGWLEAETGFDLTPCHDAAGTFTGGPGCVSFPQETHHVNGSWNDGCAGGQLGAAAEICEGYAGPFDPDPGEPDPDPDPTGDPDPTIGPADTTGDPDPDPTGFPDPTTMTTDPLPPDPPPDPTGITTTVGDPGTSDESSSSDGTAGENDLAGRGCGCATTPDPRSAVLWLVGVLALRRRR